MARFRNILVHLYAQVDVGRVYDNLQNHLDDFGQFAQYILDFLAQQPPSIQNDTAVEGCGMAVVPSGLLAPPRHWLISSPKPTTHIRRSTGHVRSE